jgi:hypothetical protein
MTPKPNSTLIVKGHFGVDAFVAFNSSAEPSKLVITITSREHMRKLQSLFARALNCKEQREEWEMDIADMLETVR